MSHLLNIHPICADQARRAGVVQAEALPRTVAGDGVRGGAILEVIPSTCHTFRVGMEVAVTLFGDRDPTYHGVIRSIAGANKNWILFHVAGQAGMDFLLLVNKAQARVNFFTRSWKRLFPDMWLNAFPPEYEVPQEGDSFALRPYPSPPTPTLPRTPPPSFTLDDDGESLIFDTAREMVEELECQLRTWMRKGCPGHSRRLSDHLFQVANMNDSRDAALRAALEEQEEDAYRSL